MPSYIIFPKVVGAPSRPAFLQAIYVGLALLALPQMAETAFVRKDRFIFSLILSLLLAICLAI